MVEETNGDACLVVNWVVRADVRDTVYWTVRNTVNQAVRHAVRDIVYWNVSWSVNNAAYWIVYSAVHGIRQPDPEHLALQEFLYSCGTEMGTQ